MSQQFSWGPPSEQQDARRLPPISTSSTSQPRDRTGSLSRSPSRTVFPPLSSAPNTSNTRRSASRNSSVSSTAGAFPPPQSGSQQQTLSQLLSSGRTRNTLSSSNPLSSSSATGLPSAPQGAGSGGGGTSRLARGSPSLSQSSGIGSPTAPTSAPAGGSQSLDKILIAQISLLLGSIPKEDQDKAGFETKNEQIRKLVATSGMDVFTKYFRRLVQSNAGVIFPQSAKSAEPTSYQLLAEEMKKLRIDPDQADKVAASLDTTEGDVFKDFDLSAFLEHFKLDSATRFTLALSLKDAAKPDLKSKADSVIAQTSTTLFNTLAVPEPGNDISAPILARIIEKVNTRPPRNWDNDMKQSFERALHRRYEASAIPPEVAASLQTVELVQRSALVRLIQQSGSKGTVTVQNCLDVLANAEMRDINYTQVADTLVYLILVEDGKSHNVANFVTALREHKAGKHLDWQDVVHAIDREGLLVTKPQFLALYNALLPLAQSEEFDIQLLWGGRWQHIQTQLAFVVAFLTCTSDEIEVSKIPRLRRAFTLEDFGGSSDSIKEYATSVVDHPLVSLDATAALFNIIFQSRDVYDIAQQLGIPEMIINPNTQVFVVTAAAVPKPWGGLQDQALRQLLRPFVEKQLPNHDFVLEGLWKQDSQWLADKLCDLYLERHSIAFEIYAHARAHGWLNSLISRNTELSLDLASCAHGENTLDIESWTQQTMQVIPDILPKALSTFLTVKAEAELNYRSSGTQYVEVPLNIRTVHALLGVLEGQLSDEEEILEMYRQCLAAYPRLINYGDDEAVTAIIEQNSAQGHGLSPDTENQMTDYFKRLYRQELEVREYVELLQRFKHSENRNEQDLFVCMINGLFEEYSCFGEYPLEALAVTAVLFGSVINFNLLERIALQAALAMVLKAVQDHTADNNMYKFGLQALINFSDRLQEWPTFCDRLARVPQLRGTEIWDKAQKIANEAAQEQVVNGNGLTNGNIDAIMAPEPAIPHFTCVHADPPLRVEYYEEPNEDTQDKVLFVLNNISERNLQDKLKELKEVLEEKHHQWFAQYLVEERAKSQQNFHKLYLSMLNLFDDHMLWAEVLRESYVSIKRLLNSETILNNSMDRNNLKNLGGWLGSLTLARDRPIKFKNISFKELLIEGQENQRLTVVIPFTCKVLVQASQSTIFKPPNPWLMEIIAVLKELYEFYDIKLNLKFEIEVLCKEFDMDVAEVEASEAIRTKPQLDDDFMSSVIPLDGVEHGGFGDVGLMSLGSRRAPSERFSPNAILEQLPSIGEQLMYPPASSRSITSASQNQIFLNSVQQAIAEIIAPVVERSVTIAAISSAQLVTKDFAMEPDVDRFRDAATAIVKALSGSLALVTCKEPLRMSITNNIRLLARELPEQALPEGLVIMFVNDNLDTICKLIEESAESQSIAEVEQVISDGVLARERWRAERPNDLSREFSYPQPAQWAFYIPEPYKQQLGGLNREQLAVYEEFGRNIRGLPPAHAPTPSQDNGRQVPDVIQDSQFPVIPNLPTPAGAPAVPNQPPPQQRAQPGADVYGPNGVAPESGEPSQQVFAQLRRETQESQAERIKDLTPDSPIRDLYERMLMIVESAVLSPEKDELCRSLAWSAISAMFEPGTKRLEVEVMASVLQLACQFSVNTTKAVVLMLNEDSGDLLHVPAAVCLIQNDLLDPRRLDELVARTMRYPDMEHAKRGVQFMIDMADEMLTGANGNEILAFRSDFVRSFEALTYLLAEHPDFELAKTLAAKLHVATDGVVLSVSPAAIKQDQIQYMLEEWIHLQRSPQVTGKAAVAFVQQLHSQGHLADKDEAVLFLRTCIDLSVSSYEEEFRASGNADLAYVHIDGFARLIISLVIHQSGADGAVKPTKAGYFEILLAFTILCMCKHQHERQDHFAQKVFYRLFASMILEIHKTRNTQPGVDRDLTLVLARGLLAMQPRYFPAFTFGWVALISHRLFLPVILKSSDQTGWDIYLQLTEILLKHSSESMHPNMQSNMSKDLYRAVLRILLILHHDFPEFLAENHVRLCNMIPAYCTQLRNLVISAYPSTYPELPDPFSANLKVDRIEDIRKDPLVRYDIATDLDAAGIKSMLYSLLSQPEDQAVDLSSIAQLADKCNTPSHPQSFENPMAATYDHIMITAIVMALGANAITAAKTSPGNKPYFRAQSIPARVLSLLALKLHPESRYHLVSAMVNQLRFPNSHTHWFSSALLHLFTPEVLNPLDANDQEANEQKAELEQVQQQATRVLLERLLVHRPHPWGLIITLLELLKNDKLGFWDLGFVKANPEVSEFVQQMVNMGPRQGIASV